VVRNSNGTFEILPKDLEMLLGIPLTLASNDNKDDDNKTNMEGLPSLVDRLPIAQSAKTAKDAHMEEEEEEEEDARTVIMTVHGGLGEQLFQVAAALCYGRRTGRRCVFEQTRGTHRQATYWKTLFDSLKTATYLNTPDVTFESAQTARFQLIPEHKNHAVVRLKGFFLQAENFGQAGDWDFIQPRLFPEAFCTAARCLLLTTTAAPNTATAAAPSTATAAAPNTATTAAPNTATTAAPNTATAAALKNATTHSLQYCAFMHVLGAIKENISYYERAITAFASDIWFLVFCDLDDRHEAQTEFKSSRILSARCSFVDSSIPDHMQLLMMAQCPAGGILAASAFSAWVAYLSHRLGHAAQLSAHHLNPNTHHLVQHQKAPQFVVPDHWDSDDIFAPHWLRVP
jgi:hypothetical protein